MRPIIDPDNLIHSEETKVYISRVSISLKVLLLVLAFGFSFYLAAVAQYLAALIIFGLSCYFIKQIKDVVKEWEVVQMRINSRGIQIKKEPIIPWDKIENERVITVVLNEHYDRHYEYYFAFYDVNKNATIQFNSNKFNLSAAELLLCAKIHRGRFNQLNTPN